MPIRSSRECGTPARLRRLELTAIIDRNDITSKQPAVATLTIRDLDDDMQQRLRVRAADAQRSMEEEARQILRAALLKPAPTPAADLGSRIRARFADLGGIELPILAREAVRRSPDFV